MHRSKQHLCTAGAGNLLDSERRDFWLAEAEEWGQRALDEIAFHFRECNGACVTGAATNPTSNESPHEIAARFCGMVERWR
jgi:hypothetical protein